MNPSLLSAYVLVGVAAAIILWQLVDVAGQFVERAWCRREFPECTSIDFVPAAHADGSRVGFRK